MSSLLEALCRPSHAHTDVLPALALWYPACLQSCGGLLPRQFRPRFTTLQYSSFLNEPGRTTVYYFPKLRELERIMLAVFHAAGHTPLALACADKTRPVGAPQKVQGIKNRLQSLLVLIRRFITAIIKLGILVPECT